MEAQKAHHTVARWSGLDDEVRKAHTASHRTNDAPRVVRELTRQGIRVDRTTVAASIRRQGLEGISPLRVRPAARIGRLVRIASRIWSGGAGIPENWMRCGSWTSRTCPRTSVTGSVCRPRRVVTACAGLVNGRGPGHQSCRGGPQPAPRLAGNPTGIGERYRSLQAVLVGATSSARPERHPPRRPRGSPTMCVAGPALRAAWHERVSASVCLPI
jgi:hypothetical protein